MITKSNSGWLDTFINVFANKDTKAEEQHEEPSTEEVADEKELCAEAEINVQSLPTVMWNDNKFYVQLDPENSEADVLNEYGNVVTTIKNVNSVEDVDAHLNDSKVVAAKCELSDADLDKVAKLLHMAEEEETNPLDEAEKETTAAIVEETTEDSSDVPVDESVEETVEHEPVSEDVVEETVEDTVPDVSEVFEEPVKEEVEEVETDIPNCQCEDCREEAQTDVREVLESTPEPKDAVEVLTEEVAPEHECNCEDGCECEDGMCQCAEKEEDKEDCTEAMRVSIKSLQKTIATLNEKIAAVEQLYARNNPGNAFDLDSNVEEMQHVEETADAAAEEIALEHTVDISTPEGRCTLKQNILDAVDEILNEVDDEDVVIEDEPESVTEEVTVEPVEEVTQVIDDVPAVVEAPEDEVVEEIEEDVPDEEVVVDEDVEPTEDVIVALDEKDSNIFKNQVCPICGEKALALAGEYGNFQGVVCENCGAEFGVNTDTEEIFHKE